MPFRQAKCELFLFAFCLFKRLLNLNSNLIEESIFMKKIIKKIAVGLLFFAGLQSSVAFAEDTDIPLSYTLFDPVETLNLPGINTPMPAGKYGPNNPGTDVNLVSFQFNPLKWGDDNKWEGNDLNIKSDLTDNTRQDNFLSGYPQRQIGDKSDLYVGLILKPFLDDQNYNLQATEHQQSVLSPLLNSYVFGITTLTSFFLTLNIILFVFTAGLKGKDVLAGKYNMAAQVARNMFAIGALVPYKGTVAIIYFLFWIATQGVYFADTVYDVYNGTRDVNGKEFAHSQVGVGNKTFDTNFQNRISTDFIDGLDANITRIVKHQACIAAYNAGNKASIRSGGRFDNQNDKGVTDLYKKALKNDDDLFIASLEQAKRGKLIPQ